MPIVRRKFIVDFTDDAVRDFDALKAKDERKALFNVVDKLRQLGPKLMSPHMKSLKGETDLFELRPRQGSSKSRPIFVRTGDDYLVLAIALDHDSDMATAVQNAKDRLKERRD